MPSGLSNKLAGQIGEFLVCAELGRHGLIATSFTGNVPEFDLLVCDEKLRTIPIQVKATRGPTFPSRATNWLEIEIDEKEKRQINRGKKKVAHPFTRRKRPFALSISVVHVSDLEVARGAPQF